MTPGDRSGERLLTGGNGARSTRKQPEPVVQFESDVFDRELPATCGRQFNRQRNAVEPAADLCHGWSVVLRQDQRAIRSARSVIEQSNRVGLVERRNPPRHLSRHRQRLATCREHRQVWVGAKEDGDKRRAIVDQVLTVVEDEQRPIPQGACDLYSRICIRRLPDPQGGQRSRCDRTPPSATGASSTQRTARRLACSLATAWARRDLPTPPDPVRVTTRRDRARSPARWSRGPARSAASVGRESRVETALTLRHDFLGRSRKR